MLSALKFLRCRGDVIKINDPSMIVALATSRMQDLNYIEELKQQLYESKQQVVASQAQLREKTIQNNAERACKEIIQILSKFKTV